MEPITTILGGLLGGALRLFPELFSYLDKKNERKHELDMQDKAKEMAQLQGTQVLEAKGVDYEIKGLDALMAALAAQAQPTGVRWVDAMSALMRPLITIQWVVILYPGVIVCRMVSAWQAGGANLTALPAAILACFGAEEQAVVAGIINFWFLDRVLRKK